MQTGHILSVRRAVATDRADLAALLSDMQAHYGSPDPPGGAAEMARLLTRTGERLPFALVAERDGALLGLASLSPVLFGGAFQWMLFLKDLYVTGAARSLGVGRALLAAAARTALEKDYCASTGRPTPPMTARSGSMTGWVCRAMTSASIA
ncbi:MAG TPA: GNAT family N-acetyltransferase [Reyranella sp.]|nr:GNAT family N-acetyltransferase [Reyranella sp.]